MRQPTSLGDHSSVKETTAWGRSAGQKIGGYSVHRRPFTTTSNPSSRPPQACPETFGCGKEGPWGIMQTGASHTVGAEDLARQGSPTTDGAGDMRKGEHLRNEEGNPSEGCTKVAVQLVHASDGNRRTRGWGGRRGGREEGRKVGARFRSNLAGFTELLIGFVGLLCRWPLSAQGITADI